MEITIGTDVFERVEFAEFLNRNGIVAKLGTDANDYIDGMRMAPPNGRDENLQWDIFQSRWTDYLAGKINSRPDLTGYVNWTYRRV